MFKKTVIIIMVFYTLGAILIHEISNGSTDDPAPEMADGSAAPLLDTPPEMAGRSAGNSELVGLTSTEIVSSIDNGYVITEISHHYENPSDETTEVMFQVALSDSAFISNFTLRLNDTEHHAEVLAKDEARQMYDEAVADGKTTGLGTTGDARVFTFMVNIKSEQKLTASLRYEDYLTRYLGEREFRLHLGSMGLEDVDCDIDVNLRSDPGLKGVNIENYEEQVQENWEDIHNVNLGISQTHFTASEDLVIRYTEEPLAGEGDLVGYYDFDSDEYYFMNRFSPQESELGGTISKDIVFVLDRSGSMSGTKITQLKQAFEEIIGQLPETDRFNIIMFDSTIELYQEALIEATEDNRMAAIDHLNSVGAGGSTNLYDGLAEALDMLTHSESRAPIIVMLTDGLANSGTYTSSLPIRENIRQRNTMMAPIFTLGFGDDVDLDFLSALSLENHARAQEINTGEDASEQMVNFYQTISTTLVRDIRISYPEANVEFFPSSIPALYEGSEAIIVGKMVLEDPEEILESRITGRSAQGERTFSTTYQLSREDTGNGYVKRFYTYALINHLMEGLVLSEGNEKAATIDLIQEYSINAHFVTPYTSLFLRIDEPPEPGTEPRGDEPEPGLEDHGNGTYFDLIVEESADDDSPALGTAWVVAATVIFPFIHRRYRRSKDGTGD